ARADDDQMLRHFSQGQNVVADFQQFGAGKRKRLRRGTRGDEKSAGLNPITVDLDGTAVNESRRAFDEINALLLQRFLAGFGDAAGESSLTINDAAPVYLDGADVNPEFSGMADFIQHLGAAHQNFFRIASIERAQSADC